VSFVSGHDFSRAANVRCEAGLLYTANRHDQGRALIQGSLRRLFQQPVKSCLDTKQPSGEGGSGVLLSWQETALAKQLYPDQDSYKREEQRRFEILDSQLGLAD
jgi:hypothetical protein